MSYYGGAAFGSGGPSFNPGAFDLSAGGLGGKIGGKAGAGKGGGFLGGMDPLSMVMGGANIGVSIWQGINQKNAAKANLETSANFARAKMAAARDRLANEMKMFQTGAMFSEGSKIGDRVAGYGYGADLNFGRQLEGQRLARTELADLDFANNLRNATATRDFELSGATQSMLDKRSRRNIKESLAQRLAAGRGMFGPIAPVDVNQMVA